MNFAPSTALSTATLLACFACQPTPATPRQGATARKFSVQTAPVTAAPVQLEIAAVGAVRAFEHVPVVAKVAGAVQRVRFTEGDTVQRGQVLVEIEVERYRLAVAAATAACERADATHLEAQAQLARRESPQAQSLGIIPHEQLAQARTKVATLRLDQVQAQVALRRAQLDLQDAHVRAPHAGIMETREVQTGQYVQPGHKLAELVRRNPLLLRFAVAEADAVHLAPDMPVQFHLPHTHEEFEADIIHVAAASQEASHMVPVTAKVRQSDHPALRPGAFATVSIRLTSSGQHPVIPQRAVLPGDTGFVVYTVAQGTAHRRSVRLGLHTSDGQVEVHSGLQPGDCLVTRGAAALQEGAAVRQDPAAP
jgi:multidrug efflux system membrane fusion protein